MKKVIKKFTAEDKWGRGSRIGDLEETVLLVMAGVTNVGIVVGNLGPLSP